MRKSTTRRGFGVRRPGLGVLLAGLAVGVGVVSLGVGASEVSWRELGEVLVGGGDAGTRLVVLELRLPRIVTGLLVGMAFAVSGALLQTLARNPLASPDVIGVSAGASAAAVSVLVLAGSAGGVSGLVAQVGLPVAALLGGLGATALVAVLAAEWNRGPATRRAPGDGPAGRRGAGSGFGAVVAGRVVLVGVGVSAAANSLVSWLLVVGDVNSASRAAAWLAGSLNGRSWTDAAPIAIAVAVLVPVALLFGRDLSVLVLGDDVASALGVPVPRTRAVLLAVAAGLAATATAAAGPIAFVALVAPQVAQRLCRTDRPPLLTTAALGALLVVTADLVARTGLELAGVGPHELPVGVVTAACGAPYLIHLVGRRQKES